MTIEIAKGDILGFALIACTVGWVGVMFIASIVVGSGMGGQPRGWDWLPVFVIPAVLALIGWGEWWLTHWFMRA